jgi:hypothetical protein
MNASSRGINASVPALQSVAIDILSVEQKGLSRGTVKV